MVKSLQARKMRPNLGQMRTWEDIKYMAQLKAHFKIGQFIVDPRIIWWKAKLEPCSVCGAGAHLYINKAWFGIYPDAAILVCMCKQCGRITALSFYGQNLFEFVGLHRAARKAVDFWNKGIMPNKRNPASIPLQTFLKDALIVF